MRVRRLVTAGPWRRRSAPSSDAVSEAGHIGRSVRHAAGPLRRHRRGLRYGFERLPDGRRKDVLRNTEEDVFSAFAQRVLAFDVAAAAEYAGIVSRRDRAGAPIDGIDAQIASICRAHGAALATRNVRDFRTPGST